MTSTLVSSLELVGPVDEAALAYTLTGMKVLERIPVMSGADMEEFLEAYVRG